ncbi:hypothetical protein EKD04_005755 [Chloroflexales bacterium ZM16-3]|nr:hypothetical protein [Chloroflexales bacterium ZM16-3]
MTTVEEVQEAALRLQPSQQLQLIQELLRRLQQGYQQPTNTIPPGVRRAAPVADLADLTADFWPEDETADDINDYIAQQRAADRMSD